MFSDWVRAEADLLNLASDASVVLIQRVVACNKRCKDGSSLI